MPWAKRAVRPVPPVASRSTSYEINDYSKGMDSFTSNDKFPLKNGASNAWRLAQDARIITLGEYKTRKGFDYYSASANEIFDQQITGTENLDKDFSTTIRLDQPFTAIASGRLTTYQIRLRNSAGATGVPVVGIYSDNGGNPGQLLSASTLAPTAITATYAYYDVIFANPAIISGGTKYHAVAYVQPNGTGTYKWSAVTTDTSAKVSTDSGMTWATTTYGLNFRQWYSVASGTKGLYRAYKSDGTKVTLVAHNTTLYKVDESNGALTVIKSGLNASATVYRFDMVNDIVYYVNGFDGLRKWDFTTESQVNSVPYSLICAHKGLLFLGGGPDPTAVIYSNFGQYETYTSTDFIYADAPKTPDPPTAFISLNGYLFIFTINNKFILSGDDNNTFQLEEAPDQNGTYTQETVTKDDNYVYFLSADGVYRSNGTEPHLMSNNNYQDMLTLQNKGSACVCINRGRLYVWYRSALAAFNDTCAVYNINFSYSSVNGSYDVLESIDTEAYVARAISCFKDNDDMLVASSLIGQAYWQERESNNYHNAGAPINFRLQSHYMVGSSPAVLKEYRYWEPRFAAVDGNYSASCEYAYDRRNNWQLQKDVALQGSGNIWGSGIVWGAFTWGTTAETQAQLYIPGEYRRTAIRYSHIAAREPVTFLGHSMVTQERRIR